MVNKEIVFVLMILSMFLLSACDVYNTLYIKQNEQGGAIEVPEEIITIEKISTGEEDTEVASIEEDNIIIEEEAEEREEIAEDATVIIIGETELISLIPKAEDPDQDVLDFTYTSPLDDTGEWQTTYGDQGEYTVTVTASDGSLTASQEVLIIVNRKEEAPVFESFSPEDTAIKIDETDIMRFEVNVSDMNEDVLMYSWKLDGIEIGTDANLEYQTTYEDSGSHTVKVSVSDGIFDTEKIWSVTVNNVNRKPLLTEVDDIEVSETDTIVIELEAIDNDRDELSFEIEDERFTQDENSFTWETTYDDAGEHVVTVSVSDGVDTTSQEITITVENINRAPVILDIIQK